MALTESDSSSVSARPGQSLTWLIWLTFEPSTSCLRRPSLSKWWSAAFAASADERVVRSANDCLMLGGRSFKTISLMRSSSSMSLMASFIFARCWEGRRPSRGMPLRNCAACCSLVFPYSSCKWDKNSSQVSSVDGPHKNSLMRGLRLTSSFASIKKNLSWAVVTPALPNAASTRLIHVWMFFLSKLGSSTFLMWLFVDVVVAAAAAAPTLASGSGARIEAAISCAAALAEAVAILMISSTLSCGVPMLPVGWAS